MAELLDLLDPFGVDTPLRQSGRDMLFTCNREATFKNVFKNMFDGRVINEQIIFKMNLTRNFELNHARISKCGKISKIETNIKYFWFIFKYNLIAASFIYVTNIQFREKKSKIKVCKCAKTWYAKIPILDFTNVIK